MSVTRRILLLLLLTFLAAPLAHATDWYVKNGGAGANNGTSWTDAWTSFASINWGGMAATDTLYIDGGTTSVTYTTVLTLGRDGTSAVAPFNIRPGQDASHNGVVIFEGGGSTTPRIDGGGHNYTFINGAYMGLRHIKVQNNSQASSNSMVSYFGNASTTGLGNRISYVEVTTGGNGIDFLYQKQSRIDNSWIHDISCDHVLGMAGSAINNNAYDMGVTVDHNILQANNRASGSDANAPDVIQGTHGNTIHDNEIYGQVGTVCAGPNHQDGVQQGGSHYTIYNNRFYNLRNSHMDSDWNNSDPCGYLHVWNNTFSQGTLGHPAAIWVGQQTGCNTVTDVLILNNTFVDLTAGPPTLYIQNGSSKPITASRFQNNIFYDSGNPNVTQVDNGTFVCGVGLIVSNNNINAGASGGASYTCSPETGHQSAAPTFTTYSQFGAGSNNYQITGASTPDIQTGANLTSLGYASLNADINGVSRPGGAAAWDIGAYQLAAGGSPTADLSVSSIAFGNVNTGATTGNTTVTLSNNGTVTLNYSSIAKTGTDPGVFNLAAGTCTLAGSTLTPSASCTFTVSFSPVAAVAYSASITVTSDAASSPDDVTLTGTGVTPPPAGSGTVTGGTVTFGGAVVIQ